MPEFYTTFARKYVFRLFGGKGLTIFGGHLVLSVYTRHKNHSYDICVIFCVSTYIYLECLLTYWV